MLTEKEQSVLVLIVKILPMLPESMRNYLLGYGEALVDVRQDYEKKMKELEKKLSA